MAEGAAKPKKAKSIAVRPSATRPSAVRPSATRAIAVRHFVAALATVYPDEICHLTWDNERSWTLLFAVILSAQCTDARVNQVTPQLFSQFSSLPDYVDKPLTELQQMIFSTGFYRAKAQHLQGSAALLIQQFNGQLPDNMEALTKLPGVGRKTANVILWNVFRKNVGFVVDTHVSRISRRLGLTQAQTPEKIEQDLMRQLPQKSWGLLSHQLVQFGRDFCRAQRPRCDSCFLADKCPKILGD